MADFSLSPLAEDDLQCIYEYTVSNYGIEQLDKYADLIDAAIEEIATDPQRRRSKSRDELLEGCRSYPVEHHFLFYRVRNGRVEIGRILHEAMQFEDHLGEESFQ